MAEMSIMKDSERKRSQQAYTFVEIVVQNKTHDQGEEWEKYKTGVKKLPSYIKTNGLGQALAFIKERDKGWKRIYKQLGEWLQEQDVKHLVSKKDKDGKELDLVKTVINLDSDTYRQVTVETLALLNWMRRFVDGFEKQ